jgi:hypothetical protein
VTIPPEERKKMLAVRLCGPGVLDRLAAIGVRRLADLVDHDPEELVLVVNLAAGHPIWRPPIAHQAMTNLIAAAHRESRATRVPLRGDSRLDCGA